MIAVCVEIDEAGSNIQAFRVDDVESPVVWNLFFDGCDLAVEDGDVRAASEPPRRINDLAIPDQNVVTATRLRHNGRRGGQAGEKGSSVHQ